MKKANVIAACSVAFSVCLLTFPLSAGDWPMFRGSEGNGLSGEQDVPLSWSAEKNVKWKIPLPSTGNGSPIVSNGRVFLVSADKEGTKRSLLCLDRKTGEQMWEQTVAYDKESATHKTNPYGSTTPAADGEKVVVWHSSAGLYCYDFDGKELWKRDLGEFRHMWGYGSSPVLYKGKIFLHCAPGARAFMTAIDFETGKTIWETDEPQKGNGERNENNKYMGSWSTPVIAKVGGKEQIVCSMSTRVNAYDPESGKIIWSVRGLSGKKGDLAYASALIADDVCVAMAGFGGPTMGFKLGGEGDVTEKNRLWREAKNPQRIGSGVFIDGYIYLANSGPNTFQCIEPNSGKVLWQERSGGAAHWGSMVYAGGHIFVTNQTGTTFVMKPSSKELKIVGQNKIDERSNSTPAISDGQIFLRTFKNIYCIGK
ncbi:MAG: PQQ-binding-like beta-propeller repeat protein [Verrucomicrobia bacterium]|nr:PQQ-binding-like beta-propeller repeat protein [Verrucomicrobiota bacterium]